MLARALLRVLMLIVALVAPLGMLSGHAAMAMPAGPGGGAHHVAAPSGASHCSDTSDETGRDRGASIDCMIACSGMPSQTPAIDKARLVASAPAQAAITAAQPGRNPAAEPPPPRLS